jgi:hypothetical protein
MQAAINGQFGISLDISLGSAWDQIGISLGSEVGKKIDGTIAH